MGVIVREREEFKRTFRFLFCATRWTKSPIH